MPRFALLRRVLLLIPSLNPVRRAVRLKVLVFGELFLIKRQSSPRVLFYELDFDYHFQLIREDNFREDNFQKLNGPKHSTGIGLTKLQASQNDSPHLTRSKN